MKKTIAGLAAFAVLAFATPAFADVNGSNIKIEVENSGKIYNDTTAVAKTGGNYAGGSTGGNGGSGGDVESDGYHADQNNNAAQAGNGGNGGTGAAGGLVDTGDANADAGSINKLNGTDISLGGRRGDVNGSNIKVEVENGDDDNCGCTKIDNDTKAIAATGDNAAKGSRGGKGGRGGDVEASGDNNNNAAKGANGGQGGNGGLGGTVYTGEATANAGAVNVMNTTLVRVRN